MKNTLILPLTGLVIVSTIIHGRILDVSSEKEYEAIINQQRPTLVKFAANWCGVCNRVKTAFQELSDDSELQGVNFVQVDIDKAPELRKKNGIVGVPSFIFVQGNAHLKESVGVKNLKSFKDDLRNDIRTVFDLSGSESDA